LSSSSGSSSLNFIFTLKQSCHRPKAQVVLSSSSGSSLIFIFRVSQSCLHLKPVLSSSSGSSYFHLQAQADLSSSLGSDRLAFTFRLKKICIHLQAQTVLSSSSRSSSLVFLFNLKQSRQPDPEDGGSRTRRNIKNIYATTTQPNIAGNLKLKPMSLSEPQISQISTFQTNLLPVGTIRT